MDMILKNTFQSISPSYELIGDVTVVSNTTQVDFTGLNIGKDDELLLVADLYNASGSSSRISPYFNNNTTATNYYQQYLSASSGTVASGKENLSNLAWMGTGQRHFVNTNIKVVNSGYIVWMVHNNVRYNTPSTYSLENNFCTSTFTVSSLTTLSIKSSITNAIGTGSRFQLYKLVAEKVADIIVPSNTTSVDITGLDIGKENEYYLVSDVVNPTSNSYYYMYSNGNITTSNYYEQLLGVAGTSIAAERLNRPDFTYAQGSTNTLCLANIKLTNSGYVVVQSRSTRQYGSSSVGLLLYNQTSTFTTSSVTSINIVASITNAIGANSRFTLYKMK